ncbi:MAG TPA: ABC transporter ATP-binding protein [Candidatus Paceibacterota bacterium]|nr:ABC transporter ATP-binding protein [Candidatus Paceibacterota bacterium]
MDSAEKLKPGLHTKPLKFFLATNKKDFKWLIWNVVFYSLGQLSIITATYLIGRAVDGLALAGNKVTVILIGLVLCLIFHEIFYRLGHICEINVAARIRKNTKKALFDHTRTLQFGYFSDRFAGEITHKVTSTADAVERMAKSVTNNFIEDSLLVPVTAIILGFIHIYYGVFVLVWALLLVLGSWLLSKEMNRRAASYAAEEARTSGSIVDVYSNIGAVKVYGKSGTFDKNHEQIEKETKAFLRLGWWDVLSYHFQGIFIIILSLGLILISALLWKEDLVTIGSLVFVSAATLRLFDVSWKMAATLANFIRDRGEVIQNLKDLVVAPSVLDGDQALDSSHQLVSVEYKNVTFGYVEEKPVLDNFSLKINAGEKIGIVGLSGAGKTTFANLLLRFFDPQSGSILLNGEDIKDFSQEFLRSHISYISQDTSLFHASIAENIAYGSNAAGFEEIEKAASLAYATEFIETLPQKYESVVGERGIKLSGGQRQRIAIARAILADRPLFLLDEATSALDSDSESKIQKGLEVLMKDKTVIAIAHRLSTLARMNRIIYLEDGKIIEDGTHEELLGKNGKYAKLWNMQAGGFLPS